MPAVALMTADGNKNSHKTAMHTIKCLNKKRKVIAASVNGVQQLKLPSEGQTGMLASCTPCPLLISFNTMYLNHATSLT